MQELTSLQRKHTCNMKTRAAGSIMFVNEWMCPEESQLLGLSHPGLKGQHLSMPVGKFYIRCSTFNVFNFSIAFR